MLDTKHFKIGKEEYVILKKDTLEDAIFTAITLVSMLEENYRLLAMGYGDENFDISNVTVAQEWEYLSKHSVNYRTVAERVLENL